MFCAKKSRQQANAGGFVNLLGSYFWLGRGMSLSGGISRVPSSS